MTTLYVDTTARYQNAATSDLCARIIVEHGTPVVYRPISQDISEAVALRSDAQFIDTQDQTPDQRDASEFAAILSAEFFMAKNIVINMPLSGGSIPASFRSWINMIALADFDTDDESTNGFHAKSATLVVAAGGLKAGSEMDTLTPTLINMLEFIGIQDIEIVSADQTAPGAPILHDPLSAPVALAA